MSGSPPVSVVQEAASPKAEVRLHAAAVLASLGGAEADEALASLLADPDHRVRARAVAGLAAAGAGGRASCNAVLLDASSGVAGVAAARALAASSGGAEALLAALCHASPTVRLRAARELPAGSAGPEVGAALEAAARSESDPDVGAELLLALGRTRRGDAASFLLRTLREGTPHARAHAAWALGVLGDPRAATRLLPVLDESGVGACALAALALLAAPEAAEELARRGARDAAGARFLLALARGVACGPPALARRVRSLWPGVAEAAQAVLSDLRTPRATASDLARLLARLDAAGAAALIVRHGPFPDGYAALADLPPERLSEAARTALVVDDPEPALTLLLRGGVPVEASALLAHVHPRAKTAALNRLAPGSTPLPDLLEILADDDADTALAAAWAVARDARREGADRARAAATALHDRAGGPDGPGRAAALTALREEAGPSADVALRAAFSSRDAGTRAAAVAAASGRMGIAERDVLRLLDDEDAGVRTEALWTLGRLAGVRKSRLEPRHVLRFLNDDAPVAAAAGALLVTLAGADRSRVAREMLAQRGAVRRSAMEAIADARDSTAAAAVTFAVLHEDASTARAVLEAAAVAPPHVAAEAVTAGLADGRPEVRVAAASAAARAGDDLAAALAVPIAEALDRESDPEARAALLRAVCYAGRAEAVPAVTRALVVDARQPEAQDAARALARRFPEAVRGAWASAPPQAGRAWGSAIEAVRRCATLPEELDDDADALRLLASLARRRTGLSLDPETLRPRLALLLGAEAWAAGSFRLLWRRMRDLPLAHPLLARLVDSVADTSSRFFADPGALEALSGEIAPERLLALGSDGVLEVWCVGCGTGEEVWSAAIRLAERGVVGSRRVRIRGTDLSEAAIRQARAGVYGPHALRGVPDAVRTRYFQALSNGRYRVREALRETAFFEARPLADEPAGAGKHDVILCHGLLPQIPAPARAQAVERLGACLKPGGYLLLGREDHVAAAAAPLAPVLLGGDLAYRRPGAVVYTRALR